MKQVLNIEATLIPKGKGIFDVAVDGQLVYSKHQTGEFPDEDLLLGEIQENFT